MAPDSRTSNAKKNMLFGYLGKLVDLLLPFISRTIILYVLGEKYLGLSSLFTSLLGVLNMTELGFSSAVVFSLYKPLAEKDVPTVRAYMTYYKQIYRVIGVIIMVVGLVLMPFLRYLIRGDVPEDMNMYVIYLMYLFNLVLSYWAFAYKTSLLQASQKMSVSSKITNIVNLLRSLLQIATLLLTKSYYAFLAVLMLSTLANNLLTSYTVNKMYPQYMGYGALEKEKRTELFTKVKGLAISKVCGVLRDSLDSITLSTFVGLTTVAIYGNYHYILSAVHGLMIVITISIKAGVGNSLHTETVEKNTADMLKFHYLFMLLASLCFACILCLSQDFMVIWVGTELQASNGTMFLFAVYFFSLCFSDVRNIYIEARGLWWEYRYRSIAETVANLILNVLSVYYFGLPGVLIATLATFWGINLIYGSTIIFKEYFGMPALKEFALQNLGILLSCAVSAGVTWVACSFVQLDNIILQLLIKACICIILPMVVYVGVNCRNKYMRMIPRYIKHLIKS